MSSRKWIVVDCLLMAWSLMCGAQEAAAHQSWNALVWGASFGVWLINLLDDVNKNADERR